MTEVPEHLLRRSRERRAALGLATGEEAPSGTEAAPPPPAPGPAPARVEAGPPPAAAAAPAAPAVVEEPPPKPYLSPEAARARLPVWVMPVLVALPLWGAFYVGAFSDRTTKKALTGAALGAQVYRAQGCSACHGGSGEGGVGPALAGGESALTFPDEADHVSWIKTGSVPFRGQPYGAEDRPGGQRPAATGGMPGFPNLSQAELEAVVLYEREEL